MRPHSGIAASLLIGAITLYRFTFSAILGRSCRFLPTCSEFSSESIRRHGAWRGAWLAIGRISRCHPWGGEGFDPVPETTRGHWWQIKTIACSRAPIEAERERKERRA